MLAARDPSELDLWLPKGPETDETQMLVTRSVKAFYDGAMGSRGAFFLSDYSDRPGSHGLGGPSREPPRWTQREPQGSEEAEGFLLVNGQAAGRQGSARSRSHR